MVYIPFIYFTLFTFILWRKHKAIDISIYITALYAFTSLCAILLVQFDLLDGGGVLFDNLTLKLNFIPTILYCSLLTITIVPFCTIRSANLSNISLNHPRLFDIFTYFFFVVALLNLYLVADSTVGILTGDLKEIRSSLYAGDKTPAQLKAETLPFGLGYLYYFNQATILTLPMFFYSICFLNKSWWYNFIVFFTTLSRPLSGIQGMDRTTFIFYAQVFVFCLFLFRPFLHKKAKHWIKIMMIPISVFFMVYLTAVTTARFGEKDGGAAGGILQYAGQNYLNFCYFYEYAHENVYYTDRMFPIYNHFVNNIDSNMETNKEKSGQHGFFVSVFPSFVGDFLLDTHLTTTIGWIICFFLICIKFFPRGRTTLTFGHVMLLFIMAIIPIFGIFYYYYYNMHASMMFWIGVIMYIIFNYQFKFK